MLAVTRSDILVTLHIVAVVVAFGGAFAYPIWFRVLRNGTREQRSFFHAAQARLGKFLIMPAGLVVFATGGWLASDFDVWGEAWVLIPVAILVVILVVGVVFLGPSEERLSRRGEAVEYEVVFGRVRLVTSLFIVLVLGATFMMVAHIPDWGGGGGEAAGARHMGSRSLAMKAVSRTIESDPRDVSARAAISARWARTSRPPRSAGCSWIRHPACLPTRSCPLTSGMLSRATCPSSAEDKSVGRGLHEAPTPRVAVRWGAVGCRLRP